MRRVAMAVVEGGRRRSCRVLGGVRGDWGVLTALAGFAAEPWPHQSRGLSQGRGPVFRVIQQAMLATLGLQQQGLEQAPGHPTEGHTGHSRQGVGEAGRTGSAGQA